MVKKLNRAVITAILQVMFPDNYGVINNTAEQGMVALGLWPDIPKGISFGQTYEMLNAVLVEIAAAVVTDLWTLDLLWWRALQPFAADEPMIDTASLARAPLSSALPGNGSVAFGLERHLHEFLLDNWEQTELARDWQLLEKDDEITSSEFNTHEVGLIDILVKHKRTKNRYLVIELKRNQSSDATVGQLLRYMGWVRRHMKDAESVEGLIICLDVDARLQYALDGLPNVSCMTYAVNFVLNQMPTLGESDAG
jgi:hypothetical protein